MTVKEFLKQLPEEIKLEAKGRFRAEYMDKEVNTMAQAIRYGIDWIGGKGYSYWDRVFAHYHTNGKITLP